MPAENSTPPTAPSQVFFGLISGAILCRPMASPVSRAPTSQNLATATTQRQGARVSTLAASRMRLPPMTAQRARKLRKRENTERVGAAGLFGASLNLLRGQPVTALAPAVFVDGGLQVGLAEVGPEDRREDHLGVGALQEEEIADA